MNVLCALCFKDLQVPPQSLLDFVFCDERNDEILEVLSVYRRLLEHVNNACSV